MLLCCYSEGRNRERNGPGARKGGREERTGRLAGRDGRGSRDGPRDGRGGGRGRWVMPTGLAFFTGLNYKLLVVWVCVFMRCDVDCCAVIISISISLYISFFLLLSISLSLSYSSSTRLFALAISSLSVLPSSFTS